MKVTLLREYITDVERGEISYVLADRTHNNAPVQWLVVIWDTSRLIPKKEIDQVLQVIMSLEKVTDERQIWDTHRTRSTKIWFDGEAMEIWRKGRCTRVI